MLKLIYEKSSFYKSEIVRLVVEGGGRIPKNQLINALGISIATINKYLYELGNEVLEGALIISENIIIFDVKKCSLYDVQKYYFSKSIIKDVLTYCFSYSNITFERLARELYISHSKLFNILKFMDKELSNVDVSIRRRPYIKLEGSYESIMVIYNLYLQAEKSPVEKSFSKLNITSLRQTI
ncbi:helix-turn-helix domain-containing protein, partial [Enterococcus hirae]